jgi:hypothetical protein
VTAVEWDPYFGVCPSCLQTDGFVNVGRNHWFFCRAHQTKWCAGDNLFSGWREETPDDWAGNESLLAGFAEVEPW